jgi:DNA-binding phage protein
VQTVQSRRPFVMARPKSIPDNVHPVIRAIFQRMNELNLSYMQVARRADINPKILERWRKETDPKMSTLEKVLKAVGLTLTVENTYERN